MERSYLGKDKKFKKELFAMRMKIYDCFIFICSWRNPAEGFNQLGLFKQKPDKGETIESLHVLPNVLSSLDEANEYYTIGNKAIYFTPFGEKLARCKSLKSSTEG
ncbi:hypothetical protein KIN20_034132 [Parelaphostrongylus tenuis]|uniref:Uncharacterized protein n=1 Tax=Parelaphostrongylus tenuis TaxID=148309 RepID=A0AAD5R9W6_PARTN|nr:hypothetical protein KIN20_034132 [Parelaphostrongylus tenuis]